MPDPAPSPKAPDLLEALSALRAALPVSALSAGLPLMCSMLVLPWLEVQRTVHAARPDGADRDEPTARRRGPASHDPPHAGVPRFRPVRAGLRRAAAGMAL